MTIYSNNNCLSHKKSAMASTLTTDGEQTVMDWSKLEKVCRSHPFDEVRLAFMGSGLGQRFEEELLKQVSIDGIISLLRKEERVRRKVSILLNNPAWTEVSEM